MLRERERVNSQERRRSRLSSFARRRQLLFFDRFLARIVMVFGDA